MQTHPFFKHMSSLPDHEKLFRDLLNFFAKQDGISAAFVSGSGATGKMDGFSDLDLGFLCESEDVKEKLWAQRFEWNLPGWFHRMDADHIKSYFIIYLFEPAIHVDLCFYTLENLPSKEGAPYRVAFDLQNQLGEWIETVNVPQKKSPDWSNVVHEEERMWTWLHYAWGHVARGEYYNSASEFGFLRNIPQAWEARLEGSLNFVSRRLEHRGETKFAKNMKDCFPKPDRTSLKTALLALIAVHESQRKKVEELLAPEWKTTPYTRQKIRDLIANL